MAAIECWVGTIELYPMPSMRKGTDSGPTEVSDIIVSASAWAAAAGAPATTDCVSICGLGYAPLCSLGTTVLPARAMAATASDWTQEAEAVEAVSVPVPGRACACSLGDPPPLGPYRMTPLFPGVMGAFAILIPR